MDQKLKLVLATDYSNSVVSAEQYTIHLAKATQSSLTIIHVYEIPFSFPSAPNEYAIATENLRKHELQKLQQHYNELLKSFNFKSSEIICECMVMEGNAGRQISHEASRINADIIILGTHGSSGFHKLFLGSHTWDVIKNSTIPVLAIPQNAFLTPIKQIAFATEYREGEIPGIGLVSKLAKHFGAELTMVHISNYSITKELEQMTFNWFKTEIQNKLPPQKLQYRVLASTNIIDGLEEFCEKSKTDWLAMSHTKSSLFERIFSPSRSITKEMTFHTHIPLLSIPDNYEKAITGM